MASDAAVTAAGFDRSTPAPSRSNGLDTLRAAAITLVFMYHYMIFVSREATFGWASVVGWVGVDLFFVLSGYLIANQLFAGVARGEQLSFKASYLRRGLRTLPVFWVVLALYFLFPSMLGGRTPPPLWTFLSFTQNFGLQPGTAFSHAWSLCIEEQFYLVLPPVIVLALRFGSRRAQAWMLIAALLVSGMVARAVLWQSYGRESGGAIAGYHPNIYYATLCRFDEFLPGIAVAMLKNFHHPAWERLTRYGHHILAVGVAATALMLYLVHRFYFIDGYGYGFFMTAFGYSLVAMAFAVLVVAALCPNSWLHRIRVPGASRIALWSYAIYLSHKGIAFIVQRELKPFEMPPGATPAIIVLTCLAGGWLLHRFVETPFMALRDRRFPSNFASGNRLPPKEPLRALGT